MRAITTASSAPATARNTTLRAVSARDRPPPICRCRPIHSFPIPKSRSAKSRTHPGLEPDLGFSWTFRVVFLPQDRINERTIRFPADQPRFAVDRTTAADHGAGPLLVRGLSDA